MIILVSMDPEVKVRITGLQPIHQPCYNPRVVPIGRSIGQEIIEYLATTCAGNVYRSESSQVINPNNGFGRLVFATVHLPLYTCQDASDVHIRKSYSRRYVRFNGATNQIAWHLGVLSEKRSQYVCKLCYRSRNCFPSLLPRHNCGGNITWMVMSTNHGCYPEDIVFLRLVKPHLPLTLSNLRRVFYLEDMVSIFLFLRPRVSSFSAPTLSLSSIGNSKIVMIRKCK
mmetsp:Transcript_2226/g.3400  ORF Transcript_2226/g.3400 Transcript_2226/m.3400 type:complete len:227 (-) Transcript_2226:489-1169(-)